MSIVLHAPPAARPKLSFTSTVQRALIHRHHPSEAFLADLVRTGPYRFVAAALLPAGHPHYTAHTGPSRELDPMLLLECVRQAETYAAHTMFGVEPDARFALRNWSAEFADTPTSCDPTAPTQVLITAVTSSPRLVRDRVRGLDYELHLWVSGERVGQVRMSVNYLGAAAYAVVRARRHNGSPPSSDTVVVPAGCAVAPAQVGRIRATDTLLLDVAAEGGAITARLRVPAENPSLFDHALDHVPAMVLVEAARQLAALASRQWGAATPDRTRMAAMCSSFAAYAELAEPIELRATPADGDRVDVTFRQDGADIAQAQIAMTVPLRRGQAPA